MGIAVASLVVAAEFVSLHTTMVELRETVGRTKPQMARLSAENAELAKSRGALEEELAKLRGELEALKTLKPGAHDAPGAPLPTNPEPRGSGGDATSPLPIAERAEGRQRKAQMHRRYDPFLLQQRGLSPAQADRFVELEILQEQARQDLQASVEQAGLSGDANGVEALRSKLYAPISKEMREILGTDGYAAYHDFEKMSYYRDAYVEPMLAWLQSANASLSPDQVETLVRVVAANDHPRRLKPTDIGSESQVDWDSVVAQASATLTPAQMTVVQVYANRQKSTKPSP